MSMKALMIREMPDEIHAALVEDAARNRRSMEKHALFLLETAVTQKKAVTCGELLAALDSMPPPEVNLAEIDSFIAARGRRSNRP